MKNKIIVSLILIALMLLGMATTRPEKSNHENLKVLPKDISNADLDSVMAGFERGLGVGCDFCHSKSKTNPSELDFASDAKPEKEITRKMMSMTEMINKEFFDYTIEYKANELMAVSCYTCHDGFPRPDLKRKN
jgi:hypothetical protein